MQTARGPFRAFNPPSVPALGSGWSSDIAAGSQDSDTGGRPDATLPSVATGRPLHPELDWTLVVSVGIVGGRFLEVGHPFFCDPLQPFRGVIWHGQFPIPIEFLGVLSARGFGDG